MNRLIRQFIRILAFVPLFSRAAPARFEVTVQPNPLKVSEFSDVTVKALDSNWNVDTSTDSDIWLEIENHDYTNPDIVLPGGGIWFFEASDQGVKIFSKWLSIKKAGTYKLNVVDVYDTGIKGTATITVLANSPGPAVGWLNVSSPLSGSVEKQNLINVVGKTTYANTPIVIMIDGTKVDEWLSDQNGDFSLPLAGITAWPHTLVVNALDLTDKIVATSGPIPFIYEPDPATLFLWLAISPAKEVEVRTKMTFTITTDEEVGSAMLKFGDSDPVPTTKESAGVFVKDITYDEPATYPIDVILTINGKTETFTDVDTIKINDELRKITTFEATPDPDTTTAKLDWTYVGKIDYFKVTYGTSRTNLRLSVTSTQPTTTLLIAEPTLTYYAQVFPVDEQGNTIGEPSDVISIEPLRERMPICGNGIIEAPETCDDANLRNNDGCSSLCQIEIPEEPTLPVDDGPTHNGATLPPAASSCYPEGIQISSTQVGEQYYIIRSPVPNAKGYQIYRSDQPVGSIDQMIMIGNTNDTRYAYPFNPNAEVDTYAWYAVRAICDNDEVKPVGDMTMVKVGPEKTLIILMLASLFVFGMVRLTKSFN
jgi:cysteine-rich repeat protein